MIQVICGAEGHPPKLYDMQYLVGDLATFFREEEYEETPD